MCDTAQVRRRFIQNPLDDVDCFAGLSFRHESYSVAEGMMSRPCECVLRAGAVLVYSRCIEGVLRAYYCARFGCRGPCACSSDYMYRVAGIVKIPPFLPDSLVNLVVLWRGPAPLPPPRCHPRYPCRPEFGQFQVDVQWFSLFFCSLCGMCRKPVSPVLLQWTVLLARHRMRWVQHTALHVRPASQA